MIGDTTGLQSEIVQSEVNKYLKSLNLSEDKIRKTGKIIDETFKPFKEESVSLSQIIRKIRFLYNAGKLFVRRKKRIQVKGWKTND